MAQWRRKVDEWIVARQGELVDLLRQMVRLKSVNSNFIDPGAPREERPVQELVRRFMEDSGLEVDSWEVEPEKPNVVGRIKGRGGSGGSGGGRSLLINGHIDVVPPGDLSHWTKDPWGGELADGRIYGRGATDMKAGVAAFLFAGRAVRACGVPLEGDLTLVSVVDEESGGQGTRASIDRGYVADAVLVAEPTEREVLCVEGGLEWVKITVKGRAEHAARRYAMIHAGGGSPGVNAIEKAAKLLAAVQELEREWAVRKRHPLLPPGITTINPGVILGGAGIKDGRPQTLTNPAIVPDCCIMEFGLKYLPDERVEDVKQQFEERIRAVAQTDPWLRDHPPAVEWGIRGVSFPPVNTPEDHPLVQELDAALEGLSIPYRHIGMKAVTDAAWYARVGIPSVIYGPGHIGTAHAPDEYCEVSQLIEGARVIAAVICRWCGGQI